MPELAKPLPAEDRLVLLPKNPGSFFLFWRFSSGRSEAFRNSVFSPEVEIRLSYADDNSPASSAKAGWDTGKVYLPVPAQGRTYLAALYGFRNGAWEKLLESNAAAAPAAAGMAEDRAYASLEFHKKVLS